jgi:DNA adenine methylase
MDPLLKWPGGKRKLVNQITRLFPLKYGKYFEPFLGGGALFFKLLPTDAYLSDQNPELMNAYIQVKNAPGRVINELKKWRNTEKGYYRVRALEPSNRYQRAARLIYLCTLSFNGIYRQNLHGEFNVPYSFKTHLNPCDEEKIHKVSESLCNITLQESDFGSAISKARSGDLAYFDPPYTVAHGNNGFVKYNAKIFSWEDQVRLAKAARLLGDRGCSVYVSNADHESIHALYKDFRVATLERQSVIAASGIFRKKITECVFYIR